MTKKEVYCRGGTKYLNHNFSLREILLLCQTDNDEVDLAPIFVMLVYVFLILLGIYIQWPETLTAPMSSPNTTPQTQVSRLPFTSELMQAEGEFESESENEESEFILNLNIYSDSDSDTSDSDEDD